MKKLVTPFFAFAIVIANSNAQSLINQANIWYFNYNCGIDFNSGVPVALNNSVMNTNEGCTSVCDSSGTLLFYSDGVTVYNANHLTMLNGTGLNGSYTSSQSCIAMRQPGSSVIWYLFTVAPQGGIAGAQYSIIDMSLQGGLGEVTVKNVPLVTPVDEKLSACLQSNGIDNWVAFHGYYNDEFYIFPLTSSGVGTAVTSAIGGTSNNFVGCMKFSPDGTKLAEARYELNSFQVFNFDNSTGIVTYDFTVPFTNSFASYGVEWSRDSRHLFMGNVDYHPGEVYEVDMSLNDTTAIIASKTLVAYAATEFFGSLQMAPDGKIYLVRNSFMYLGVINYPDSLGSACAYVSDGLSTAPHNNNLGLPNYVTSWYVASSISDFSADTVSVCATFCINFFDSSSNNPVTWLWNFTGGTPGFSVDQNPMNICYQNPGVFDVTLITSNANGIFDTLTLSSYITVYTNPFAPVITHNGNTLTSTSATSYQWQLNSVNIPGATNQSYTITQSGLYTVIIGDANGCNAQASVDASLVGISDMEENSLVNIFPNPSSGSFIVEWLNGQMVGDVSIDVVNTLGQKVFSSAESRSTGTTADFKKQVDLSDVSRGVYFVGIKTGNEFVRKKILIAD